MDRVKLETPGPRPTVAQRKVELMVDVIAGVQGLERTAHALRTLLEAGERPIIAAGGVMACLLELSVVSQKLCQLEIVVLSEAAETNDHALHGNPGGNSRSHR